MIANRFYGTSLPLKFGESRQDMGPDNWKGDSMGCQGIAMMQGKSGTKRCPANTSKPSNRHSTMNSNGNYPKQTNTGRKPKAGAGKIRRWLGAD